MAFQPIVDVERRTVFAHESLVRGLDGAGAAHVLSQVNAENRYAFDQACRTKAVELASGLGLQGLLSINFLPNAVYEPETCIRATLAAARRHQMPTHRLLFEITESEQVRDKQHLRNIVREYRRQGFKTAIDDFGAGYAGLNLLADFQPDYIKLDMDLIRDVHENHVRQVIVRSIIEVCRALRIEVIAEGVESVGELRYLRAQGVKLFQGYLFSRPVVGQVPGIHWAAATTPAAFTPTKDLSCIH
ncbi:EAL domain-containing protein [Duganella sp. FT3S]|uniref:EAL domain-containing protein n=2 Tax=Rugamonas fusca TaxID=2758568 RepID=A0A7W2EM74_9BURK|nr:EAL domain-containing protein [Rugamonas fusca]